MLNKIKGWFCSAAFAPPTAQQEFRRIVEDVMVPVPQEHYLPLADFGKIIDSVMATHHIDSVTGHGTGVDAYDLLENVRGLAGTLDLPIVRMYDGSETVKISSFRALAEKIAGNKSICAIALVHAFVLSFMEEYNYFLRFAKTVDGFIPHVNNTGRGHPLGIDTDNYVSGPFIANGYVPFYQHEADYSTITGDAYGSLRHRLSASKDLYAEQVYGKSLFGNSEYNWPHLFNLPGAENNEVGNVRCFSEMNREELIPTLNRLIGYGPSRADTIVIMFHEYQAIKHRFGSANFLFDDKLHPLNLNLIVTPNLGDRNVQAEHSVVAYRNSPDVLYLSDTYHKLGVPILMSNYPEPKSINNIAYNIPFEARVGPLHVVDASRIRYL